MFIQFYAFQDPQQAREAALLGVDYIGFVAGDYGLVPGENSFEQAREIVKSLPPGKTAVALTMSTSVDEIIRMANAVRPHVIHISTDMDDVPLPAMREIRQNLPQGVRLMKAISVTDESSLAAALHYAQASDLLLLDTKSTDVAGIGVSGQTHDWNISRQIVEQAGIPVILAGGMSAENVAEGIRRVRPFGVDSNTHTNVSGSLVNKDMERIRAFVTAVRAVEKEIDAGLGTG